jgi:hypothetical protein
LVTHSLWIKPKRKLEPGFYQFEFVSALDEENQCLPAKVFNQVVNYCGIMTKKTYSSTFYIGDREYMVLDKKLPSFAAMPFYGPTLHPQKVI